MEPKLGPDITSINPRQQFKIFIPDWNNKRMNTFILIVDDQLSEDQSMCGIYAHVTRPKLRSLNVGSINNKLILFFIEGGSGHEGTYIGPMSHLGLGIAADDLKGLTFFQILLSLPICSQYLYAFHEHPDMNSSGHLAHLRKDQVSGILICESLVHDLVVDGWKSSYGILDHLYSAPIKYIEVMLGDRISFQGADQHLSIFFAI